MTIDASGGDGGVVLSAGWSTKIEVDPVGEGMQAYRADIYRKGIHVCRIALTWSCADEASASKVLEGRIAHWIADYEGRGHSGDTGFENL